MKDERSSWELMEEVVSIIEKTISPDSKVERDVRLPDLSESSVKRQCDIVIRSGKPPRETISIVEVQDRSRKFDITFFDGLCTKMRKVGAQHLICVSRQDFPKSIRNEALRQGPTVRLVTLRELKEGWPVNILENCIFMFERTILEITDLRIGVEKGFMPPRTKTEHLSNDKLFEIEGQSKSLSINDLINVHIKGQENQGKLLPEGITDLRIALPESGSGLWHVENGIRTQIKALDMTARIENKKVKIPLTWLSYSQADSSGPLAWLMEAMCEYQSEDFTVQMTLVPLENGSYKAKITKIPDRFRDSFEILEM